MRSTGSPRIASARYADAVRPLGSDRATTVFPAQRQMLRGLVVARWATLAWMGGQIAVGLAAADDSPDALDHPVAAFVVFGAVAVLNALFSVALRTDVRRLLQPRVALLELAVAFGLYVADGWVFVDGHVFASQLALASSWPLVAVLSIAIVHGERVGFIAGAFAPMGRIVGAWISGVALWTQDHVLSFASSIIFYAVAGAVIGVIARQLRNVENDNAEHRAREEVGRQLHDGVLQTLALVERRAAATDPELARAARASDRELREWLWAGRPSTDDDVVTSVRQAAQAAAARHSITVSVSAVGEPQDVAGVPTQVAGALSGAVGELVTNVAKHARVSEAVVFVDVDERGVSISVSDQGIGLGVDHADGDGLMRSVRGRVGEVGGDVSIASMPGGGTEVILRWVR